MAETNTTQSHLANAERRLIHFANHIRPVDPSPAYPTTQLLNLSPAASNSYKRVHGEVSSHEVSWEPAVDESGKEFIDIIYEKAVGEGIAKVKG